ncbi:Germin-like protein 9-1 [Dichanthelium oligosanthes]|uniref:Germin-like protein n=1 Tax=Dichanthelium oligosanthes TaxID=888268 RepID=A0A1E5VC11_9POAL|nr:Germin-like protein 9-1 [Dichanthelium oligosanthes]
MALTLGLRLLLLFAVAAIHQLPRSARAGDPNILTDYVLPSDADPAQINGTFFTYTHLVSGVAGDTSKFTVSKATAAEFPALMGQSVSYASLVYGAGTVNPPHIHPRASELLLVVQGPLLVGLIDAAHNGTVYTAALETGDMFVFPKGMVHWQFNNGTDVARAFSAFGSATPGTISLPTMLFETGIDDPVLEKSFRTDEATVKELKQDLREPAPGPAPEPAPSSSAVALVGGSALLPRLAAALLCAGAAFWFGL